MKFWRERLSVDLVHVLLVVTVIELIVNRLAVPALRPPGDIVPPTWHHVLDSIGLYFLYFASGLAIGTLALKLRRLIGSRELYWAGMRLSLVLVGASFLTLACINIAATPTENASFLFDSSLAILLLLLVIAQVGRGGDIAAKVGVTFLAIPILIHYYTPFALRFVEGEEAVWGNLPVRVLLLGQWSMVFAALASPYCFAPRPFLQRSGRLAPAMVTTAVSVAGIFIMNSHYNEGMMLAALGIGVDIGPAAPTHHWLLYIVALASITWTVVACFTAESPSRREIGFGVGLVVVAGYGFAWPLQYLVAAAGLLNICEATVRVGAEEQAGACARAPAFRSPPMLDEVWQRYVAAIVAALRADHHDGAPEEVASAVTVRGDDHTATTHLVATRHGVPVRVRIERRDESVVSLDVVCGEAPPDTEPTWTLHARPEQFIGVKPHPEPPPTSAPQIKTGDHSFDLRFQLRQQHKDGAGFLDDELRARATAVLDGWIACWSNSLRYRVYPGVGAPLDDPIPITELAFRGTGAATNEARLLRVIDLLAEIAAHNTAR